MIISADGINAIMCYACRQLIEKPEYISAPRGLPISETIDAKLILYNPRRRIITTPARKLSRKYLAGELAFYLAGSDLLQFIAHYSKFWEKCSDDGETVNSAYGKRLLYPLQRRGSSQFRYAFEQLKQDKDTRKAVMMIYAPSDAKLNSKDNPCTIYLQFFIRENELHLFTYMRSNDIWFGASYDIPFFTIIQELMLVKLQGSVYPELQMGTYVHNAGSLHLYGKNVDDARELIGFVITDDEQVLPDIKESTFKEMDYFLRNEEKIRGQRKMLRTFDLTDPFLLKLLEWLQGEPKE